MDQVPFFQHDLGEEEIAEVRKVLSGNILTTGQQVLEFEAQFAEYLGVNHVVGVTSCTGALHLSLAALDIGNGDEVITTPLSFIATATAIIQAGATPVFVDVERHTGNIDLKRIESAITPRTKAIIPVHLYGQMVDMLRLRAIADAHSLHIIEDSAHCIEGAYQQIKPGTLGDTACFSFYATKNITSGEGGAIATNNDALAKKLKLLRHHGMDKTAFDREKEGYSHWDMPIFGWKYNMDNIQAALLLPQLNRIDANLRKRAALAHLYYERLKEIDGVSTFDIKPEVRHAHHLMPIRVSPAIRDRVVMALHERGIGAVVNYRPIHLHAYFREKYGFENRHYVAAEEIGDSVLSLPLYPNLRHEQVEHVVERLSTIVNTLQPNPNL